MTEAAEIFSLIFSTVDEKLIWKGLTIVFIILFPFAVVTFTKEFHISDVANHRNNKDNDKDFGHQLKYFNLFLILGNVNGHYFEHHWTNFGKESNYLKGDVYLSGWNSEWNVR